jgi:site-specific recombinase XerC
VSPRKTPAGRDRSAEHAWNANPAKSRALHGPGTVTAAVPLTDKQKLGGARVLGRLAPDADALLELLDAAGLDLSELRALRAARITDRRTS